MRIYMMDFESFRDVLSKPQGLIFAEETETHYCFETVVNFCTIRCEVAKTTPEDNLMFLDSWIVKSPVIRWVKMVDDKPKINIEVSQG